jgi:hypothetical protein
MYASLLLPLLVIVDRHGLLRPPWMAKTALPMAVAIAAATLFLTSTIANISALTLATSLAI